MGRLNLLLLIGLVVSALSLVTAHHEQRTKFVEHERIEAQARQLDIERNRLQLEQSTLSKSGLIEATARKDLHMQPISTGRTEFITLGSDVIADKPEGAR